MAGQKSIGSLVLFISANATAFMAEFGKVDRQLARASARFSKPGAKLALGFLGVQNTISAISSEIRNVVQNIESIPGVPAETVASIIGLRDNLAAAKNWIDRMTAGIIGFGVQAAQAVGVGAAGLMGYHDTTGLSRQETPDEIASAKDPQFHEKINAARAKLAEASKAAILAGQTEVQQIISLRQEAERYETFAASKSINTVQRLDAETSAQEKLNAANAKMAALRKELDAAEKKSGEAFGAVLLAASPKDPDIKMKDLKAQERAVRQRLIQLRMDNEDQSDPANLKEQIELRGQLTTIYERQVPLLEKQKEISRAVGETLASAFEGAIFDGKKLSDTLKGLASDLLRMAFRKSMIGLSTSFNGFGLGGFFADGGRPPVGVPSIVGERGPEIFVPDVAGKIIPNRASSNGESGYGGSGGDGFHFVYNIASGVTRAELKPLLEQQRTMMRSEIPNLVRRGGAYRSAFA